MHNFSVNYSIILVKSIYIVPDSVEILSLSYLKAFREHGEIEEGAVIVDKATGKSRGYGFITYKHMESAQRALREPSKLIDVRNIINYT